MRGAVLARHQVDPAGDLRAEERPDHPVRGRPRPVEQRDGLAAGDQRHRDEPDRRHRARRSPSRGRSARRRGGRCRCRGAGRSSPAAGASLPSDPRSLIRSRAMRWSERISASKRAISQLARPAVQRGRHQMPDRDTGGPGKRDAEKGHRGEQDDAAGIGDIRPMEFGEGRDEVGARRRGPDRGLAEQGGDRQHDHGQGPGLAPALREPVGRNKPPERGAPFHGARLPRKHANGTSLHGCRPSRHQHCSAPPGTPGTLPYVRGQDSADCYVNDW